MTSIRYKGFEILTRPYQLHETRRWTVDLEIHRRGRRQPFSLAERYSTEEQADARCSGLGRRIIDGRVPGWSIEHLRGEAGSWSIHPNKRAFMRPLVIAGIVILCLGAVVLIRGASFTSRQDVLQVGDLKVTANQQQTIPPWVGGAAVAAGVVLIVAGARKRS